MNLRILLQHRVRRNSRSASLTPFFLNLRLLSQFSSISAHKHVSHRVDNKKLSQALRVVALVASPKPALADARRTHLRLIEDFLQKDSFRLTPKRVSNDDSAVYDKMLKWDVVEKEDAMPMVIRLHKEGLLIDAKLLSSAISFCGSQDIIKVGVQVHCLAIKNGFMSNVYIGSSLISFYSKCRRLDDGYRVFDEMPVKNVVSWTAIIAGYAQEWRIDVCLELYCRMRSSMSKPNDFTFTSLLSACTGSGALGQGRSAHCQVIQMGLDSYLHIANALLSMYCKCGDLKDALYIFENIEGGDVVSWNSMIAGYALHGLAEQAIDLFKAMKRQKVKPDGITFLGVLSCCRHSGLVREGRMYFESMLEEGVKPELDHYSCIVDLLGRAGLLEEAEDFIHNMPINPNAVIWGSLLSSCRLHGNVWTGIRAAENRLLLEPGCVATHLQLANLYASVGYWDQAANMRKMIKDKGLKTNAGYSWVEIQNEVHKFRAEDRSNSKMKEITDLVDSLVEHMRKFGHDYEIYVEDANNSYPELLV
ncbi:Pentatricopeptide repeat [Dillenia turbinata]|uniref:Pentatricopeptide repeat n=1 Tax=Dillenia turbinata TaxID=194707 RepID=A0AAN8VYS9_9MAGN